MALGAELEIASRKAGRFGWDRNDPVQVRITADWMDALQDYPLAEVRAAIRRAMQADPKRAPNESQVVRLILDARREALALRPRPPEPPARPLAPLEDRRKHAAEVLEEFGFAHLNRGAGA